MSDMEANLLCLRLDTNEDAVTATGLAWLLMGISAIAREGRLLGPDDDLTIHELRKGSILVWLKSPQLQGAGAVATIFAAMSPLIAASMTGEHGITECSIAADRLLHHEGVTSIELRCHGSSVTIRRQDVPRTADLLSKSPYEVIDTVRPHQQEWVRRLAGGAQMAKTISTREGPPDIGSGAEFHRSLLPDAMVDPRDGLTPLLRKIPDLGAELPVGPFELPTKHAEQVRRQGRFFLRGQDVVFATREGEYFTVLPMEGVSVRVVSDSIYEIWGYRVAPGSSGLERLFALQLDKANS